MRKLVAAPVLVLAWLMAFAGPAAAAIVEMPSRGDFGANRVALVVGNAAYENVTPLANTVNDARAVAGALTEVGFTVLRAEDVDLVEMLDAVDRFLGAIEPGAEALIYYAGHGVELVGDNVGTAGQNFLLPVDVPDLQPNQRSRLIAAAVNLNVLVNELESRKARVNIVILDACRNNPFTGNATRSVLGSSGGLAQVAPAQGTGTVIIYSAAAGETALDKLGPADPDPNGVFTRNLIDLMQEPGMDIRVMMGELKERVYTVALAEAGHTQRPSYYDGLIGKFVFRPGEPEPDQPAEVAVKHPCADLVSPATGIAGLIFLDLAQSVRTCEEAARRFPDSALYRGLLETVREQQAARLAIVTVDDIAPAERYLADYAGGRYAADVAAHIETLSGR